MSEVEKRWRENQERLKKHDSGMTPKEFMDTERLREEWKMHQKYPTPFRTPIIKDAPQKQRILAEVLREDDYA